MSLKVLCFGYHQFLKRVINKLRPDYREHGDDQIIVDSLQIRGKQYLAFSISNPQLIVSQATGTSGILYFLDPSLPLYEQKQFLFTILSERKQFQSIPIVIVYDKDQAMNIKQIVNQFQLFKVKDRASMIKEVDLGDKQTINQIFGWVDSQVQFRKTRNFEAAPKIVKMKPKYRESEPQNTQNKYQGIIRDKKLKNVGVKSQQQAYIQMQKQRIKNQNMEKQLANFNRNKKKMAPYDIKATPNPKIDANLHFFLKDPKVQKAQEVNIKIQTDQFKQKLKQKAYVPKKTGVNTATQIQPTQLFDFVKQVQPILDILTTRALQSATLQIQQEQEILKISKYKNAYNDRVKKQKKHEQQNIETELQTIKQKDRILQIARKRDQAKKQTMKKQSYYSIANTFLQNVYKDAAFSLYKKNLYPNQFQHALKTEYLPQVLKKSLLSYQKLLQNENCLQNVFEQNCIVPIKKQGVVLRNKNNERKKQKQQRRINKGDAKRAVQIYYDSPEDKKFTSFSKYLSNELEGNLQQYMKLREDEIQQAQDKLQSQQVDQNHVLSIKQKDNINFSNTHNSVLISNQKQLCFEVTQNKYSKPIKNNQFVAGGLFFQRDGSLALHINSDGTNKKQQKFAKSVNGLRFPRDLISFDNGVVVDLENVPQKIRSVVFYLKVNNLGTYTGQNQIKNVKNSAYGIQFYQKSVLIFKEDIGNNIKWEQLNKPAQGGAQGGEQKSAKQQQSLFVWGYHLTRKGKQSWQLQELNIISKPVKHANENQFIQKVCTFYKSSLQIFKSQQDEPKPTPKTQSRNTKRKSKKNIVQQKVQVPKNETKLFSKILKQVELDLKDNWQKTWNKLGDTVTDWKQFIENSPDGWYLEFRGKKLQNNEQIKNFSKIGDIILRKIIPVVQQQKPQVVEGGEQDKPQQQ